MTCTQVDGIVAEFCIEAVSGIDAHCAVADDDSRCAAMDHRVVGRDIKVAALIRLPCLGAVNDMQDFFVFQPHVVSLVIAVIISDVVGASPAHSPKDDTTTCPWVLINCSSKLSFPSKVCA